MGDFNLDARMDLNQDYGQKVLLEMLCNLALKQNLVQIIDFTTWSPYGPLLLNLLVLSILLLW